jgi:glycine cleavage system aminomethyltransferase T
MMMTLQTNAPARIKWRKEAMSQHNTTDLRGMAPPAGYLAARFGAVDDASIAATAGDRAARGALSEGRSTAGLIDRRNRGRLVASGRDRASYLQGMLTNDVLALEPGQGCYACYLTAQGGWPDRC